jgi:hypothetical protein
MCVFYQSSIAAAMKIVAGAIFLIRVRKMTIVGADARMRKGREQELRAKQENVPPSRFLAKGECVLRQGQAQRGEDDPVATC